MAATVFADTALRAAPADVARFRRRRPFAWLAQSAFVRPEFFAALRDDFPPLALFEHHAGRPRGWQRPHDRYYLAYSDAVRPSLGAAWRRLIDELLQPPFITYLARMLGGMPRLRFAWHRSYRGCEVSPHIDSAEKLGTMVFYCNDSSDWNAAWGGDTLILGTPRVGNPRPDFPDFEKRIAVPALETQCLLFRTSDRSWHGVERLTCPESHFRKTFHVIAESR